MLACLLAGWIGTWAAAPQPAVPGKAMHLADQTLRLIVHTSAGGTRARIHLSNLYGEKPVRIGEASIARRTSGAGADGERPVQFGGLSAVTIPARGRVVSDPVDFALPALADVAISLHVIDGVAATSHLLAQQTSYVAKAGTLSKIGSWPFLTGLDVFAPSGAFTVVAFGDSLIDGDGTTPDANARLTDVLAARLHAGVVNEGIIGNRLLRDGPPDGIGPVFGQAALARFERDVLEQAGVRAIVVRIGVNDIAFPGSLAPDSDAATVKQLAAGYRELIARAHRNGLRVIGTTATPFEGAAFGPGYWSPRKDALREKVNRWIRTSRAFDTVVDFDAIVKDPSHPSRLLPGWDSGDHLHPNDAGYRALAEAIPIENL